jgi:hypothetical protein
MTVAKTHDAYASGEAPTWAWPLYAFVAWLATMFGYVTRFKRIRRDHRFKPDWRDSWEGLRQSEWLRDQLIAQGVAQLLSNQPLLLDDTKIIIEPPATYGGPRPRTPFDMNRRFIALARWSADPEAIIRERFRRLSRDPAVAHGSTDALRAAHHELRSAAASPNSNPLGALMLSSAQSARPSKHEGVLTKARGPPTLPNCRSPTPNYLAGPHQRDRPRTATLTSIPA